MNAHDSRTDRRWLLGCLALAAGLRLFRIGHQNLWIDEMISLDLATYASGVEFWAGLIHDIHGPINSMLLHVWAGLGTGEGWLRLLYAVASVLTVPVVYLLGTELFDRKVGRVAGLVAAISPFHVWYAQEIRSYSWAMLWITGTLLLFVRLADGRGGGRTWAGLGVLLLVGILTNYSFVFLVVALTVAVLSRPPSRAFTLRWGGVLLGVGVVFLPWFLDWFHRIGGERMFVDAPSRIGMPLREASGFSLAGIPYLFWTFSYGYTLGPSLRELHLDRSLGVLAPHLPVLAVGALSIAIAAWAGWREVVAGGRTALVAGVVGVPLLLAVFLASREIKTFHPRYLVAFFPLFLVVLAAGWARGGKVARISGVVAGALAVVSLGNHYFHPAYAKEDSRAAARLILEREEPGDSVVVIYAFRPFRHYFVETGRGRARLHHVHKRFLRTDDDMRRHVEEARRGAGRVWLVLTRWWDVAPEDRIRRIFEESLDETDRWELEGVKVMLYEGRPS